MIQNPAVTFAKSFVDQFFASNDKAHLGYIDATQLGTLLKQLSTSQNIPELSPSQVQIFVREADINQDGKLTKAPIVDSVGGFLKNCYPQRNQWGQQH